MNTMTVVESASALGREVRGVLRAHTRGLLDSDSPEYTEARERFLAATQQWALSPDRSAAFCAFFDAVVAS